PDPLVRLPLPRVAANHVHTGAAWPPCVETGKAVEAAKPSVTSGGTRITNLNSSLKAVWEMSLQFARGEGSFRRKTIHFDYGARSFCVACPRWCFAGHKTMARPTLSLDRFPCPIILEALFKGANATLVHEGSAPCVSSPSCSRFLQWQALPWP